MPGDLLFVQGGGLEKPLCTGEQALLNAWLSQLTWSTLDQERGKSLQWGSQVGCFPQHILYMCTRVDLPLF